MLQAYHYNVSTLTFLKNFGKFFDIFEFLIPKSGLKIRNTDASWTKFSYTFDNRSKLNIKLIPEFLTILRLTKNKFFPNCQKS